MLRVSLLLTVPLPGTGKQPNRDPQYLPVGSTVRSVVGQVLILVIVPGMQKT